MGATIEEIQKHKKTYIAVFAALAVLTVITVVVSRMEFTIAMGVFIALAVAATKGTLVGGFFMHLFAESKAIYWMLALCVIFFIALMALPVLTSSHANYRANWWGPPAVGAVEIENHGDHAYNEGEAHDGAGSSHSDSHESGGDH